MKWTLFLAVVAACGLIVFLATRSAQAAIENDKKLVAALDTQYQAAVEKNDATTMDRLLADDFILVTGSGKVYSKSDLLEEARGGHTRYEHQSDTEQTVRVWKIPR